MDRRYPKSRNRRDIGEVVFLHEKMQMAREISSCCVGTEALLESNQGFSNLLKLIGKPAKSTQE